MAVQGYLHAEKLAVTGGSKKIRFVLDDRDQPTEELMMVDKILTRSGKFCGSKFM